MSFIDSTTAHAGVLASVTAAVLMLLAFIALPRGERYLARGPLLLLLVHLLASALERNVDPATLVARLFNFVSVFSVLGSIARSAFLLGVMSRLARRFTRPWPRIHRDLLQAFLYFAVGIVALRAVGVEPVSLLATSAVLTAVLGLSLQETLGNLFAGLALQAQPPFSVGDWLQFAEGPDGIGRVLEINWRATHLVTISEVEVIVPNGVIAKAPLRNFSRPTAVMRHTTTLVLPDSVAPHRIQNIVLRTLGNLHGVLRTPPPSVLSGPFIERGATYAIRFYIEDFAQIEPIEGELRRRLWYWFRREGIELPPPRSRVEAIPAGTAPTSLGEAPRPGQGPERSIIERLQAIDFLGGVGEPVLERLAQGTKAALYGPGEAVIHQGESGNELFVIEQGTVEVLVTNGSGLTTSVARLTPGQFFGEAALLRDEQRTATVVATSECRLLVISAGAFRAAAEMDRSIADRITTKLAARLTELSHAVTEHGDVADEERRSLQLIERVKRFFHG